MKPMSSIHDCFVPRVCNAVLWTTFSAPVSCPTALCRFQAGHPPIARPITIYTACRCLHVVSLVDSIMNASASMARFWCSETATWSMNPLKSPIVRSQTAFSPHRWPGGRC